MPARFSAKSELISVISARKRSANVRMTLMEHTDETNDFTDPSNGERVLIVEDDPSTRTGLAELVQAWGFITDEAPDGEEALRKVTTFRPAIIVSDLVMPRLGGRDLLRA